MGVTEVESDPQGVFNKNCIRNKGLLERSPEVDSRHVLV